MKPDYLADEELDLDEDRVEVKSLPLRLPIPQGLDELVGDGVKGSIAPSQSRSDPGRRTTWTTSTPPLRALSRADLSMIQLIEKTPSYRERSLRHPGRSLRRVL